ncbi:GntR family transcriptional regulator [Piscinibacter sakaiensis]|uniref:Transcriptional regulator, GntR family n=1 Tax=Piscinibacter sakaiensis TaxID=1547922 RepID=A0A0K8P465_PISS1|nr:GntR family transcriptional regulator [Piscinibacter sakaiensis]GAP36980.1 transcriptional regulator, GntR family [Piscinibacter sakaiensis]
MSTKLSERLREAIEEEIATGRLLPGTRLDELELAARFEVSRTPIREALSLLAGEGLIETAHRRGAVVAQITPERLVEMFEVMAELEALSARLAARRISDAELQELERLHEECRQAAELRDTDAYFYANERFHYALYASAHNRFLCDEAVALQKKLRPYRRLQLRVRNRMRNSHAEHAAIVQALRDGDGEAAVRCVRSHVLVQGERFADLIASLARLADEGGRPEREAGPAEPARATAARQPSPAG